MNIENKLTQLYKNRLVLHFGFWIICLILGFFGEIGNEKTNFDLGQTLHMLIHFIAIIGAAYFNMYFLIPRYLITHKYQTYFVFVILIVAISTIFSLLLKYALHEYVLIEESSEDTFFMFFHISFYCLLLLMITTLFYFLRRRMNLKEMELKLQEIENQKTVAELKVLKAQINPHLLFNALNNIYSLALESNTKTPKAVLELSELMTYVLYDCQADKISLSKEIAFIKNYIVLEKSRFEESVNVNFEVDSAFSDVTIAPLIFIPFIENAFKHCDKTSSGIADITIKFETLHLPLFKMKVENSYEPVIIQNEHKGVGLENVTKRLALIYPDKHKLTIQERDNRFYVLLEMDLS